MAAEFRIDQIGPGAGSAGLARHDLVAGAVITCVVTSATGPGITHQWVLLDKVGSTATVDAPTATTMNIGGSGSITAPCAFRIQLTENNSGVITSTIRIASVRTATTQLRIPPFGELAPASATFDTNTPDLSTDNAQYADLAGTGISGQNWRGWVQWAYEVVTIIDALSGGGYIPSGPAAGDITGTYPASIVVDGLQGRALAATAPANDEALVWHTGNNRWQPKGPVLVDADFAGANLGRLVRTAASTYAVIKDNLVASTDPAVTDNIASGYQAGSIWVNQDPSPTLRAFIAAGEVTQDMIWLPLVDEEAVRGALAAATANVAFNSKRLTSVADPVDAQDAATMNYVDNANSYYRVPTTVTVTVADDQQYLVKGPLILVGDAAIVLQGDAELAVTSNGLVGPQGPPGPPGVSTFGLVQSLLALADSSIDVNAQRIVGLATGTANTDAANVGQVQQPAVRSESGATDTIVAGDIGNIVMYTNAGAVTVNLPELTELTGRAIVLTFQATGAATVITVDPGVGVTIDGSGSNFVASIGRARVSLISADGLAFYSGTP